MRYYVKEAVLANLKSGKTYSLPSSYKNRVVAAGKFSKNGLAMIKFREFRLYDSESVYVAFINKTGKIVISDSKYYLRTDYFDNGFSYARESRKDKIQLVQYNASGKAVKEQPISAYFNYFSRKKDVLLFTFKPDDTPVIYNQDLKEISVKDYYYIYEKFDDYVVYLTKDKKKGVIDSHGKVIIKPIHDTIYIPSDFVDSSDYLSFIGVNYFDAAQNSQVTTVYDKNGKKLLKMDGYPREIYLINGKTVNGKHLADASAAKYTTDLSKFNLTKGIITIHPFTNSKTCLDVSGASKEKDVNIALYNVQQSANQIFRLKKVKGKYQIIADFSGKALSYKKVWKDVPFPILIQTTAKQDETQMFTLSKNKDGSYCIINSKGDYLTMAGGSDQSGTALVFAPKEEGANKQKFSIK